MSTARDWSDWLSPVVVKNMRQDTRTPSFGLVLMGAQLALGIVALSVVLGHTGGTSSLLSGLSVCFWLALIAWLLLAIPQRALSSLRREDHDSAFELVAVTRLDAWRLVLGTWTSLMLQAGFGALSLLPYMLLRYFFGGVEVFSEVVYLAVLVLLSGLLTACGLFSSTLPWAWTRRMFSVGLLVFGAVLAVLYADGVMQMPETLFSLELLLGTLFCVLPTLWLLVVTAGRIAPLAENHALRKRLFGLGSILVLGVLMAQVGMDREGVGAVTALLLVVLCADAAYERVDPCAVHYLPFVRYGLVSRLVGLLLCPGWLGGVAFLLLVAPAVMLGIGTLVAWPTPRALAQTAAVASVVLLPLAMSLGRVSAWGVALVVHPLMALIGLVVTAIQKGSFDEGFATGVVPLAELVLVPEAQGDRVISALLGQGAICGIALAVLGARVPAALRAQREAEQHALAVHLATGPDAETRARVPAA
jgi:hypothetical protein